jgi:long-chain acyl-CoA synthetase
MSTDWDETYKNLRAKTVPGLLCERARNTPEDIAYRAKRLGIYETRTWQDLAGLVAQAAQAFAALGLNPGDRVAIMGDPCEEWVIADLAAQALGCVTYGIYPTASLEEVTYQMKDGGAVLFVAEDQEYVDKILEVACQLDMLRHILVIDPTALFAYEDTRLLKFADTVAGHSQDLTWLEQQCETLDPAAPAFIVYTSGTTGAPKGALISHGRHLAATMNIVAHYPVLAEPGQRTAIFLPLCHVLGRDIAITLPLLSGLVPYYGEDIEDISTTIFEVAPTILFTVPRYLQKWGSQILIGIANTSGVKRGVYEFAMRRARQIAEGRWAGQKHSAEFSALWVSVFRPILNRLGFDQLRLVISGGAPLPTETAKLWQIYGLNVVEMYGQTETAGGIISGQQGPYPSPGDVGTAPAGWDIRLGDGGEIQVYSPDLFEGYWNNEAATEESFTADGWLKTGDIGEWKDGGLRLIDRARDFIVTAGGKTISPAYVENALRASPYLSEVVVFGQGRKYLTALIEIDYEMVADWARGQGISYSGFTNLAENPRTQELIRAEMARCNQALARVEQVKDFRILYKELDPEEEGEPVTPTRKVKRNLMYDKFSELVEDMYDTAEDRLVAAAVVGD